MVTGKIGALKSGSKQWYYCLVQSEDMNGLFEAAKEWMQKQSASKVSINVVKGDITWREASCESSNKEEKA